MTNRASQLVERRSVHEPDTSRVDAIERCLLEQTRYWASLFRYDEFGALARVVVASAPTLCFEDQLALTKFGAWICGFDDLVDDPASDEADISLRIDHYEQLVTMGDCPELRFDPVASLLFDAIEAFTSRPAGRSLWSLFATQMLEALEAMRWERRFNARAQSVSLAEYLNCASNSIFVKPVATAAAILLEDETVLINLQSFLAAERHMATTIRIVNDRATRAREASERSINAFVACRLSEVRDLDARATSELRELNSVLAKLPDCPAATFVQVFCVKMIEMYGAGDLA